MIYERKLTRMLGRLTTRPKRSRRASSWRLTEQLFLGSVDQTPRSAGRDLDVREQAGKKTRKAWGEGGVMLPIFGESLTSW